MGGSGNWLKSFISNRKSNPNEEEKVAGGKKSKKWKLWRSSSSSDNGLSVKRAQVAASESSDLTPSVVDDVYSAAMATLIRAPPKDFLMIRQEWAAIRIQTAFRALLARRAFRALKALVRLQAIVRGRLVRKQAAVTLKCMQALVRAQAQIKARRVRMSLEGESLQKKLENESDPVKQAEGEWCASKGSMDDMKTKLQMRQEAAIKREKAIAYSISQQQLRATPNLNPAKKDSFSGPIKPGKLDKSSSAWSWLDGWMTSKPWESRPMEDAHVSFSTESSNSEHKEGRSNPKGKAKAIATSSNSFDHDSVRVARNNITRRITARPPVEASYCSSSSQPSSKFLNNESSLSSSTAIEGTDETASSASVSLSKPRYMNPTASNRAKQRGGMSKNRHREALAAQHCTKSGVRFSGEMTRSSVDSAPCSVGMSEHLYTPSRLERYDWTRCR